MTSEWQSKTTLLHNRGRHILSRNVFQNLRSQVNKYQKLSCLYPGLGVQKICLSHFGAQIVALMNRQRLLGHQGFSP